MFRRASRTGNKKGSVILDNRIANPLYLYVRHALAEHVEQLKNDITILAETLRHKVLRFNLCVSAPLRENHLKAMTS